MSYTIAPDGGSITCKICGLMSYNANDIAQRFCAHCNVFHDDERHATTEPVEYDCVDCGRHVVSWINMPKAGRCSACAWVVENIAPHEQAAMRAHLGVELKEKTNESPR